MLLHPALRNLARFALPVLLLSQVHLTAYGFSCPIWWRRLFPKVNPYHLTLYQGPYSYYLNAYLRSERHDDPKMELSIATLDREIRAAGPINPGIYYRGEAVADESQYRRKVGETFPQFGYFSTSTSLQVARKHANGKKQPFKIIYKVHVPKGVSAIPVPLRGPMALWTIWEREVLFPRGLTFRVLAVKQLDESTVLQEVEMIPAN